MEVIVGLHNVKPRHKGAVITFGNFDGVHHGHQMLLAHLSAKARELDAPSMLVTFEPQPAEFLNREKSPVPARLTRFREKICLLTKTDLTRVLCLSFNERTRILPAEWVVDEFLHKRLTARYVVVGDDFRFGEGAKGDYTMLKEAGDRLGFEVSHMGTLTFDHERVSSTRIRTVLAAGDFSEAAKMLGHEYFIMGRVIYGRQLGRQLGVPTANIPLQRYRAALEGVYAVRVDGLDKPYQGIANIGVRPTVDGKKPLLEVHLFDFSQDIYGKLLTVTFEHKIRNERTFESLDALKERIAEDIVIARNWFAR
ncbi:MAG: bifunctional riboflavin kinase/FAD synthetase [Proteobacteria bacterium]|nr:bifunctional riboflavin kinase/FAD synthetase [Pseudomonadota bacterium]